MNTYKAFVVKEEDNQFSSEIIEKKIPTPKKKQILIRVSYSSLNYKDYLSFKGNRGVTQNYPHVPGIDAVGVVEKSRSKLFQCGDKVIVTGYGLGVNTDGGFSEMILVPEHWVVAKPRKLTMKESMIYGTAGLTAAQCVEQILYQEQKTKVNSGEVIVSGATGGVGSIACLLLSHLGFRVVALSRKHNLSFLKKLKIKKSISLNQWEVTNQQNQSRPTPLASAHWRAAIDTVGGELLEQLIKSTTYRGTVTTCGMVAGKHFKSSVFPFILRGIRLVGIDCAQSPLDQKKELWKKLSGKWKLPNILEQISEIITLDNLEDYLLAMGRGETHGRIVLKLQ